MDLNSTSIAVGGGLQYNMPNGLSIGSELFYTRLAASDAFTTSSRAYRKINVRTDVLESSIKLEYTIPTGLLAGFYGNIGAGALYCNPKGLYNGTWYDLRPFGTEGQIHNPNQEIYKPISAIIPFGFGKKSLYVKASY